MMQVFDELGIFIQFIYARHGFRVLLKTFLEIAKPDCDPCNSPLIQHGILMGIGVQ